MMRRAVGSVVDASGRHPLLVLLGTVAVLAGTWYFALQVLASPHTDLRELLPVDSPGLRAFEHQLGRVGGGATLIVIAQSPDRRQNERFVDDLEKRLAALVAEQKTAGGPQLIAFVESGSKEVHAFFEDNKWLYADRKDLEDAYDTIDHQIAIRSGLVEDLGDDEDRHVAPAPGPAAGKPQVAPGAAPPAASAPKKLPALGLDGYRDRWKAKAKEHDDFPTGYFETDDGGMIGVRIVSSTAGMGDAEETRSWGGSRGSSRT